MNEPHALTAATLAQVCTKASSAISQLYDYTCNRLRHVSAFMNTNCPAGPRREHPIFSQVWNLGSPLCSGDTSATNDTQAVVNSPFRPFTPGHQHPGKKPFQTEKDCPTQMMMSTLRHTPHLSCVGTRWFGMHQVHKSIFPREGENRVWKQSTFALEETILGFYSKMIVW